jgi:misacylated tRNA(Ala) deacylase|tara:strand:+ start:1166 stop:1876 length:711 start_codon:yes stop_codon:yes gene_type:complete
MTDLLFLQDAYLKKTTSTVTAVNGDLVTLDRTLFYPTGGGQPHDLGTIVSSEATYNVIDVFKNEGAVWHKVDRTDMEVGQTVASELDWERRHRLMRTHTALHILCGVIWNEYGVFVTGGNMEPLRARMDFAFDPLPNNFAEHITDIVNTEIKASRPIQISYLDRPEALADHHLIRTKVNLIPDSVTTIRVVDIVGLDKQADGGTHVANTSDVGRFEITKTESKGKGNKRVRIVLHN